MGILNLRLVLSIVFVWDPFLAESRYSYISELRVGVLCSKMHFESAELLHARFAGYDSVRMQVDYGTFRPLEPCPSLRRFLHIY